MKSVLYNKYVFYIRNIILANLSFNLTLVEFNSKYIQNFL